jgi:hypothetical protein
VLALCAGYVISDDEDDDETEPLPATAAVVCHGPFPEWVDMVCHVTEDTVHDGSYAIAVCVTRDKREYEFILGRQGGV